MQDKISAPDIAARPSWRSRISGAFAKIHWSAWLAALLTFAGWFVFDTLSITWGPIDRGVRFFDVASIIQAPPRLFTGTGDRGAGTLLFGVLCYVTLFTPVLPHLWRRRVAWLALMAPALLMAICAGLLYVRTSGDVFHTGIGADTLTNDLRHFANHVFNNVRTSVARDITLAAGGYLAALSSLYLAAVGIRGYLKHRP